MIHVLVDRRAFWLALHRIVCRFQNAMWVLPEWLQCRREANGEKDWGTGAAYWTGWVAYHSYPDWLFQFLFARSRPPAGTTLVWINTKTGQTNWMAGR